MKQYSLLFVALLSTICSWAITPITTGTTFTVCVGANLNLSDITPGGVWTSSMPGIAIVGSTTGIVTGISSGVTTITYTLSSGSAIQNVTVNANPALCTVTGGGAYCPGSPCPHVGLSCSSVGVNYQMFCGATIVGGSVGGTGSAIDFGMQCTAGIYTVVCTNPATGCTANMVGSATVIVAAMPGPISGALIMCVGDAATHTDGTPGGTWSSSNPAVGSIGSASGVVSAISAGTAIITYSTAPGCDVTATVTVNPLPCAFLGNTLPNPGSNIAIYPNPAATELNIELSNSISAQTSCVITTQLGQQLLQTAITTQNTTINIRTLPPGLYYITIKGPGGVVVRKFVKE
jgi:Secretion system C-terminal sorting domain